MLLLAYSPVPVTRYPDTPLVVIHVVVQLLMRAENSASVGMRHGAPRCAVAASCAATRLPVESM